MRVLVITSGDNPVASEAVELCRQRGWQVHVSNYYAGCELLRSNENYQMVILVDCADALQEDMVRCQY